MKRIHIIIIALFISLSAWSQDRLNLGAGYFGHFITHPGIVVQAEREFAYGTKASLPMGVNLGFYAHPRNHYGLFMDLQTGFRYYTPSGIFLEEMVGVGILQSFLHSDAVYTVSEEGEVGEGSRSYAPDFMPSVQLGLGYRFGDEEARRSMIWLRPKFYFQLPHKGLTTYHLAVQLGYTYSIPWHRD